MEQTREEKQFVIMTQTPISRLIPTLAIPTVLSMLITSIYNMGDTYFVSKISTSAAGAVGVVFSLMAIMQAIGFTIGMGCGTQIAGFLGQKDHEKADILASTGLFLSVIIGTCVAIGGLIFIDPLMLLLGSTATILPYARDYASYILIGSPIICASFVLNNFLRFEGKAALAMIGITFGGVLNLILDPLFIFGFDLGISGAAIATLISQCVSLGLLASFFLFKKSAISLRVQHIARQASIYLSIFNRGFPSFCRQGLASVSTAALNVQAAVYGDPAVAAMSIVGRIFMTIFSIMVGFGQGIQPILGYNYGAKQYRRVKQVAFCVIQIGTFVMAFFAIAGFIFAPELMALFREEDPVVITIGTFALRAYCLAMPLVPIIITCNSAFQVLGKPFATLLASARQGVFFFPLISFLPIRYGLMGVQLTQPAADILAFVTCCFFFAHLIKELDEKIEIEEGHAV